MARTIEHLKPILRGWGNYFKLSEVKVTFEQLDQWLRRWMRCKLWRQWKRPLARARMLMQRGLPEERAWKFATDGRGPCWNSGASHMNHAYPKSYFDHHGLFSLLDLVRTHWSHS